MAHRGHETGAGHNRIAKGRKCHRMGRTAIQHKGLCKGDCKQGNDLYLDVDGGREKFLPLFIDFQTHVSESRVVYE